eukprot:1157953-Pelagomonas_calceolata.AAC.4
MQAMGRAGQDGTPAGAPGKASGAEAGAGSKAKGLRASSAHLAAIRCCAFALIVYRSGVHGVRHRLCNTVLSVERHRLCNTVLSIERWCSWCKAQALQHSPQRREVVFMAQALQHSPQSRGVVFMVLVTGFATHAWPQFFHFLSSFCSYGLRLPAEGLCSVSVDVYGL